MTDTNLDPTTFRMPAEWEPHEAVWLQWPDESMRRNPGYQLKLEWIWIAMTRAMQPHVTVRIVVGDEAQRDHVGGQLRHYGVERGNTELHIQPINDVWMRDNGPIFVVDDQGQVAITDWRFNGYGAKFEDRHDDAAISAALAEQLNMPCFKAPLTTEGGAVEVNGSGTFMATKSSIIDPNRNPDMSQAEIEQGLGGHLGVSNFVWLSGAPPAACLAFGDGTDWHVDIAARFTPEGAVLYCWSDDDNDPRLPYLKQHREELERAADERGRPLVTCPLPQPIMLSVNQLEWTGGLPAGQLIDSAYTNYLVTNGVVLMPVYGRPEDQEAKAIITEHFPGHEVIGIPTLTLTEEGGAIHCVTQQQPKGGLT